MAILNGVNHNNNHAEDDLQTLREYCEKYGQEHLLACWNRLSTSQKEALKEDIQSLKFEKIQRSFEACMKENFSSSLVAEMLHPIVDPGHYENALQITKATWEQYWDLGLKAIAEGRVGVILLAGGQGTRLGVTYPKGMYDVGLASKKTLFQLQAERIRRLQQSATEKFGGKGKIHWYIMTSEATKNETVSFFKKHQNFGIDADQLHFFEQGTMPCLTLEGKIIMESEFKIARAPDGNGGLYRALKDSQLLEDMKKRGIELLHVYCVDNILVKVADPAFIGFCCDRGADCGNKVCEKVDPQEPVGVCCEVTGKGPRVVEYSELPRELMELRDDGTGKLKFRAGNIANHFFTREFLERVVNEHESELVHHVAHKKIPFFDGEKTRTPEKPNGIKMEKFVFDVFSFSKNFVVWEVPREAEFSPLKNAESAGKDCATTCREDISNLHSEWIRDAGATLVIMNGVENGHPSLVEVSPLVSYGGEGEELRKKVNGKRLQAPICIE